MCLVPQKHNSNSTPRSPAEESIAPSRGNPNYIACQIYFHREENITRALWKFTFFSRKTTFYSDVFNPLKISFNIAASHKSRISYNSAQNTFPQKKERRESQSSPL